MAADLDLTVRHYRIYPPTAPLRQAEETIALPPARTAVLAIDVHGAGHADGEPITPLPGYLGILDHDTKRRIVRDRVAPLLTAARETDVPVVYVTSSAPRIEAGRSEYGLIQRRLGLDIEQDLREPTNDPAEYVVGPASVLQFSTLLAPKPADYYIRKYTYSGFFSTRLDRLLRNLGVENVVLLGFTAETGMFCTALDAFYLGYRVVWVRDGTLAIGHGAAEAVRRTERLTLWAETDIGFTTSSEAFIEACRPAAAQPSAAHDLAPT